MKRFIVFTFLLALAVPVGAAVRLPQIFSSHAVLQRDQPLHIWGWADPGEKVSVSLFGTPQATTADRLGHWTVFFPPHPAGGPFDMTVTASNSLIATDLLFGDVWFASGQSNMEIPLNGFPGSAVIKDAAAEIAAANHPDIRLLLIPKSASPYPLEEFGHTVAWTACTPETAAKFSAVAYFFGRDLAASEHVPIGLIDSTWGGTPAEAWTSMEGLSRDASLMPVFAAFGETEGYETSSAAAKRADAHDDEAARSAHQPLPRHTWHGDLSSWTPSWLFNAMVAPAVGYALKGAIWYQGEANTDRTRAALYDKLFPAMIEDWRSHWGQGDFPFLFVQLANYEAGPGPGWPLVREAQRRTLQLINTGMAVTIDIGQPENIHPADKQDVGMRLARAAQAIAYHEQVAYTGPMYQRVSMEGSSVRVWFQGEQGELHSKTAGSVPGFEVAGDDYHFVEANAAISGTTVVVSSSEVSRPRYVRYGWKSAPVLSLFDAAGLPASPFTSEEQPGFR